MAASRISPPVVASSRVLVNASPLRTACSSGMVSSSRRGLSPSFTQIAAAPPIRATRSSDFSSSATLSAPYRRLRPAAGLRRLKSGISAFCENCRPLIATGATRPASTQMPATGATTASSLSSSSPT